MDDFWERLEARRKRYAECKQVELHEAKFVVFDDSPPDPYIRGFSNRKDAEDYMNDIENEDIYGNGTYTHYMVEIHERKTVDHKR